MRKPLLSLLLFIAVVAASFTFCTPSHAQTTTTYPIWDPIRLSVGARIYSEWDELDGLAGQYSHEWRLGVPMAWELTNGGQFPVSLTGALDYGFPSHEVRLQAGLTVLLKKAGH